MRFCSGCGERLDVAPPVTCSRCGRSHWRNAKPAAGGLVTCGDKLLLVRRAHYHAEPLDLESFSPDPDEVSEVGWFAWDELPKNVAPPRSFPLVLEAWRSAMTSGSIVTPLRNRPMSS